MSALSRVRNALLVLISTIVLAGCGGGDDGGALSSSSSSSASTSTPAATETTTKAPMGTLPTTPTAPTTEDEQQKEPDAGDEEGIRVPAGFTVKGGKLSPPTVAVPAFLRIELTVANQDTGSHTVRFRDKTLSVPGGDTKSVVIEGGLRKGRFPAELEGGTGAAILSGAEGGP